MLKIIHRQNVEALRAATEAYLVVYVDIALAVNGEPFSMAHPLPEFTHDIKLDEQTVVTAVTINLGVNACKWWDVDEETGDIVFDVGMGGRPFLGNIPAGHVLRVGAGESVDKLQGVPTPCGLGYLKLPEQTAESAPERPAAAPKRQAFKPTLVK